VCARFVLLGCSSSPWNKLCTMTALAVCTVLGELLKFLMFTDESSVLCNLERLIMSWSPLTSTSDDFFLGDSVVGDVRSLSSWYKVAYLYARLVLLGCSSLEQLCTMTALCTVLGELLNLMFTNERALCDLERPLVLLDRWLTSDDFFFGGSVVGETPK
jgi:hypothetical protein